VVAFPEYHWPHCEMNPANLGKMSVGHALLKSLQAKFTKAELAQVAKSGPMADKPIGKKRSKRPMKTGARR
jgi:hypothetical protein